MATDKDLSTIKGIYNILADETSDANQKKKFQDCAALCGLASVAEFYLPNSEGSNMSQGLYDKMFMTLIASHSK